MMKILRRLFTKNSILEIVDNLACHNSYPQTANGLKELKFSDSDIQGALKSKFIEEYDYVFASFGSGEDLTYRALKLTESGKALAASPNKNSELKDKLLWWFMGIISTIVGGLVLAYGFGVGR